MHFSRFIFVIFVQAGENLVQDFQMLLMHFSMHEQFINVDQHIWNVT